MAKTESVEVVDELKNLEAQALERRDRFVLGVVQGHKALPSIQRKKLIKEMSLFGYLATIWRTLTDEQKQTWRSAGAYSSLSNWQLFISDNAARLRHDLELSQPPSDLWQVRTGYITIEAPSMSIQLKQEHPINYYVTQKVAGKPWKNELVYLTENFGLPMDLEIRYKSDLTPVLMEEVPTTEGTISGVVTLNSVPVSGATVRCIAESTNTCETQQTTDVNGAYTFTGLSGAETYHLCVEYETGGTTYNAKASYSKSDVEVDFILDEQGTVSASALNFALEEEVLGSRRARFYAEVWTSYQGQDIMHEIGIDFNEQQDWVFDTVEIANLRGIIIGYTIYIDVYGYTGTLMFDNLAVVHGGTNWARDPRCDEVDKTFTKAFAVVPPYWVPVDVGEGVSYSSVFPPSI